MHFLLLAALSSAVPAAQAPAGAGQPQQLAHSGHAYQVDGLAPGSSYDVSMPQLAADRQGVAYHFWLEALPADPASHALWLKTSLDLGGSVQAQPVRVDQTPAPSGFDTPAVACEFSGHVYCVWQRLTTAAGACELYFNRSLDFGSTFEHDRRIDAGSGHKTLAIGPQIACDDTGHVFVCWADARTGKWHVYLQRSSDWGLTWAAQDLEVDHNTTGMRSDNPKIALGSGGDLYIGWEDDRQSANSIYFNVSYDYGASFMSGDLHVDSLPPGSGYLVQGPALAADTSGHVYVMWSDSRNGERQAWFNRSGNFGASFGNDKRIDHAANGISLQPVSVACDQHGNVYGAWHHGMAPATYALRLFLNRSSDYGASFGSADQRIDTAPADWMTQNARLACDDHQRVYLSWVQAPYCTPGCPNARDVYMNWSLDGGARFLPRAIEIGSAPPNTSQGIPNLAIDEVGHAFASWLDDRNQPDLPNPLVNLYTAPLWVP